MLYRTFLLLSLTGLFFTGAALADETKKEVHSQADLPRATYPVTGSVSTLLQSDDSVFDSTVSKAAADLNLSLGPMTWPHLLVRGLLAEQLYRAQQILAGHPYHRV